MTNTIPASKFVQTVPSVISAGGAGLSLNGLMLTNAARVPIGVVNSYPTAAAVGAAFGLTAPEYLASQVYFGAFNGSNIRPGALLTAQYPSNPVAAWVRGGSLSGMTLTQLQALSGTIIVTVDGQVLTSGTVNLATATSFSNAASMLTGVSGTSGLLAIVTNEASATACTISTTTLTVGGTVTGNFAPGQVITGTSVTAGSTIIAQLTGTTGKAGTYSLSASSTVGTPETISVLNNPVVTFDSISQAFQITSGTTGAVSTIGYVTGTLATALSLTAATGAVTSQGSAAAVPGVFMSTIVNTTTNWATFWTMFDPDGGAGNTVKLAFAAWTGTTQRRYAYACWDTDASPTTTTNATASLGNIINVNQTDGVIPIYCPAALSPQTTYAPFVASCAASVDYTETNGRITLAYKGQSGLAPYVFDPTTAGNLEANGYNYYCIAAEAAQQWDFLYPGQISGVYDWADSYYNQIWLNAQFRLALMTLLTTVKAVPYDTLGYGLIRAAMMDPINEGLNFGAFAPGNISALQAAEVNYAAGLAIDNVLQTKGWYLQILPAISQSRGLRQSPPITFWYLDRGSVQTLNIASIEVQ